MSQSHKASNPNRFGDPSSAMLLKPILAALDVESNENRRHFADNVLGATKSNKKLMNKQIKKRRK